MKKSWVAPLCLIYGQKWIFNHHDIVGNKAKERISKRMFQESKARQISEKQTFLTT